MKNILLIEIKDNKTIATLTKVINGKSNLLMHNLYESESLMKNIVYDSNIIDKINFDLKNIGYINNVDETYLVVNTKRVNIQTISFPHNYNTNFDYEKKSLIQNLQKRFPKIEIIKIIFSEQGEHFISKNINATIEFTKKNYLKNIIQLFGEKGINFTKVIPVLDVIEKSTFDYLIIDGATLSFLVEEKFTQLTIFQNGTITSSHKWKMGLTDIYKNIASIMNIEKKDAKHLFKTFGFIPPEDVLDDKVIHANKLGQEIEIFTKKNLSGYITDVINELFSNVKTKYAPLKEEGSTRLIFNGEISSLSGFDKYASKSFSENNIIKFNSNLIGLSKETEFITYGAMKNFNKENWNHDYKKVKKNNLKISLFNKFMKNV